MLAYGGALRWQGWPTVIVRSLRRSLEIWAAFLLLVIAYLALVWVAGSSVYRDETNTSVFFDNPGIALIHLLALQYTPVNTDILPLFVMLHFGFPLVLWLMIRNAAIALTASFLLYMMVQLYSWNLPAWPAREAYFNPLAWQILFVIGAYSAAPGAALLAAISRSPVTVPLATSLVLFSLVVTLDRHAIVVSLKGRTQNRQLLMRLQSSKALVGLDHAGRDPSQGHTGIPAAFDVARDAANGAHHVLGDVGTGERSTKLLRQLQPDDSQDFVEAFEDARRYAGHSPIFRTACGKVGWVNTRLDRGEVINFTKEIG